MSVINWHKTALDWWHYEAALGAGFGLLGSAPLP